MGAGKSMPSQAAPAAPVAAEPIPDPPEAEKESQAQIDAREQQRKAAAAARERSGTVLTGNTGDTSEAPKKKTVLGAGG